MTEMRNIVFILGPCSTVANSRYDAHTKRPITSMSVQQNVSQQNVSLTKHFHNKVSPCNKTSPNKTSPPQNISVRKPL